MPPDWLLAPLDVAALAAIAWAGGAVMERLRQPRIAGEMAAVFAAMLLLGGQIADVVPGQQADGRIADVFPEPAVALVNVVGALGLVLYMLLVGITIDPAPMHRRAGAIALLTVTTVGAMLALALVAGPLLADADGWKPPGVSDGAFVLALAAALAVNGLPIVARILEDRRMTKTTVGAVVVLAGALISALALLGAAVAVAGGDLPAGARVGSRVGAGLVVLALAFAITRAQWFTLRTSIAVFAVVGLAVASALAGDRLLSSLLIGPLVVGVALGAGSATAVAVERRLGAVVRRVGLPAFLGVAALHTDLGELGSGPIAPVLALLLAVIALKVAASYVAARTSGFGPADARAIGALMQCGGVMTIAISLDVFHARVIDARMHACLTLIGIATTIAAGALLPRTWHASGSQRGAGAPAEVALAEAR